MTRAKVGDWIVIRRTYSTSYVMLRVVDAGESWADCSAPHDYRKRPGRVNQSEITAVCPSQRQAEAVVHHANVSMHAYHEAVRQARSAHDARIRAIVADVATSKELA